jgi:acetyl-CoA carboxylase biotin carboxyl carrier protein
MARTGRIAADDVATLATFFATSEWSRLEVSLGDWELRLGRTPAPVPGFAGPLSLEVGAADVAGCVAVTAPHLATVRLAPVGGAAPYVALEDRVEAGTQLCGLEVMRRQSPLRAGVAGVVRRICVADGALVEAGQPLFFVDTGR